MTWSPRGRAQWLRVAGGSAAGHATVGRGEEPARLGRRVRRVLTVVALARIAQFVEAVLFPLVAVRHGAGTTTAALVLLALAVGTMAGSALGGASIDRFGPRVVATTGLAFAAAAAAGLAVASAVAALGLAAAVYGTATGAWRLALESATAHALAGDARAAGAGADQAKRERAFGTLLWLVNLGALASAAAYALGLDARLAVGLQALAMGAAAALALLLLAPRVEPAPAADRGRVGQRRAGLSAVPRELWILALAYAPFTMVMFQAFAGLAEIFESADYRLMVLVNALTLVTFPPLLGTIVARADGIVALTVAGSVQGAGVAAAAITNEPVLTTIAWSAGEATLIAVIPAVLAGIAPHRSTGSYRGAFAIVQGAAAAVATFAGPLVAHASPAGFALACLGLTALGATITATHGRSIGAGLHQPVACPCGALLCSCDAAHLDCVPSPVRVHRATPIR